ncbi:hypothetical protein M422DRAFT_263945 [Sphaerobolus stellatus SS14]|uniref:LysM domain-containing protein n=1 Tax=Sphaerobolus stellatus (strain SS14) TaxID=990650 RepID=A0A0C9V944_SPHS4|nr:hypothetical protein M422DRAFT_263945 [Sphaerobolus stellatus SS14]
MSQCQRDFDFEMKYPFPLTVAFLSVLQCSANFRHKIGQQEAAQNDASHDSIRKQLANSQNATALADGKMIHDLFLSDSFTESPDENTLETAATTGLQVYLNNTVPTSPGPPQSCVNALTATVNCNSTISLMPVSPFILDDTVDLQKVCTSTCTRSLVSYRANVVSACAGFSVKSNNVTYPATYAVDTIIGAYTVQCLQDPTTLAFCSPLVASFNATGGLLVTDSKLRTFCTLKTLNVTFSNLATYSAPLANLLSSVINICGSPFATYNVTKASPAQVTTGPGSIFGQNFTNSAPAINCAIAGKNTTTNSNTTCSLLATQFSVTEDDVLASNPTLDPGCKIPSGTTLYLPLPCYTYTIQTNDTCQTVTKLAGTTTGVNITTVQLQSFNPELGTFCQIMPLRVGLKVRLIPNGGFKCYSNWPTLEWVGRSQ